MQFEQTGEGKLFFFANYLVKHDPKLEQFRLGSKN